MIHWVFSFHMWLDYRHSKPWTENLFFLRARKRQWRPIACTSQVAHDAKLEWSDTAPTCLWIFQRMNLKRCFSIASWLTGVWPFWPLHPCFQDLDRPICSRFWFGTVDTSPGLQSNNWGMACIQPSLGAHTRTKFQRVKPSAPPLSFDADNNW